VEIGQSVIGSLGSGGTAVFTIAVDHPLLAKVMVDETDIAQIRPGLPVTIRASGVPNRQWKGTAQSVSPNAQVVNNVVQYQVTVVVRDPERVLRLGLTVDAEFVLMERRNVLLVPNEALRGAEDARALLIPARGKLVPRIVEAGGTDGRLTEIASGVKEGETVYLGEARRAPTAPGGGNAPRSPFLPNFQRSPAPRR
jgi:multidrug efflux pump subunit AcrA (membrane-fusion protein)